MITKRNSLTPSLAWMTAVELGVSPDTAQRTIDLADAYGYHQVPGFKAIRTPDGKFDILVAS